MLFYLAFSNFSSTQQDCSAIFGSNYYNLSSVASQIGLIDQKISNGRFLARICTSLTNSDFTPYHQGISSIFIPDDSNNPIIYGSTISQNIRIPEPNFIEIQYTFYSNSTAPFNHFSTIYQFECSKENNNINNINNVNISQYSYSDFSYFLIKIQSPSVCPTQVVSPLPIS